MKRIYHLSTCDTCRKILASIDTTNIELVNIREQHISKEDLQLMYAKTKSYEALFNKRAQKYKEIPDEKRPQKDFEYKKLILSDYTFLKRPAAILDNDIIVGNDPKSIEKLKSLLPK